MDTHISYAFTREELLAHFDAGTLVLAGRGPKFGGLGLLLSQARDIRACLAGDAARGPAGLILEFIWIRNQPTQVSIFAELEGGTPSLELIRRLRIQGAGADTFFCFEAPFVTSDKELTWGARLLADKQAYQLTCTIASWRCLKETLAHRVVLGLWPHQARALLLGLDEAGPLDWLMLPFPSQASCYLATDALSVFNPQGEFLGRLPLHQVLVVLEASVSLAVLMRRLSLGEDDPT